MPRRLASGRQRAQFEAGCGLSVHVLQEFHVNLVQPPFRAMSHADWVAAIPELLRRPTVPTDTALALEKIARPCQACQQLAEGRAAPTILR